jgi:hypothetical protein
MTVSQLNMYGFCVEKYAIFCQTIFILIWFGSFQRLLCLEVSGGKKEKSKAAL